MIFDYFQNLTNPQKEQFKALGALYSDWNSKINVISRKDIGRLYTRHVLHSLAIAKETTFVSGARILDVGTGGGFPGIPLAVLFPESEFLLIDSIGKKIKVVNEVSTAIGLKNLRTGHMRAEKTKGKFDFVVSRATGNTKQLFHWTHQKIKNSTHAIQSNGYYLLKGGNLEEELNELKRPYSVSNISNHFDNPFFETKKVIHIPM